ncbi:hypothetical protein BgiMline_020891, partial [Biomphalaria glabrata]
MRSLVTLAKSCSSQLSRQIAFRVHYMEFSSFRENPKQISEPGQQVCASTTPLRCTS